MPLSKTDRFSIASRVRRSVARWFKQLMNLPSNSVYLLLREIFIRDFYERDLLLQRTQQSKGGN
jgi:hypothetical protein